MQFLAGVNLALVTVLSSESFLLSALSTLLLTGLIGVGDCFEVIGDGFGVIGACFGVTGAGFGAGDGFGDGGGTGTRIAVV